MSPLVTLLLVNCARPRKHCGVSPLGARACQCLSAEAATAANRGSIDPEAVNYGSDKEQCVLCDFDI